MNAPIRLATHHRPAEPEGTFAAARRRSERRGRYEALLLRSHLDMRARNRAA